MWWALSVRCGVPPRILKKRYTPRESREMFAYWQRYPFDDESNYWLPSAMLMAELRNKFAGAENLKDASYFMPFARREEIAEAPEPQPVKTVPYTRRHLKRIQKALRKK